MQVFQVGNVADEDILASNIAAIAVVTDAMVVTVVVVIVVAVLTVLGAANIVILYRCSSRMLTVWRQFAVVVV